jgi:hypothetical protein
MTRIIALALICACGAAPAPTAQPVAAPATEPATGSPPPPPAPAPQPVAAPATKEGTGAPPPPPLRNVAPGALEQLRIAGSKLIVPDDPTKTAIQAAGSRRVIGSFKLCVSTDGATDVSILKSTGIPAYDQTIMSQIRGEWRYRPFVLDGQAVPVCSAVTFIYSQP